jgi:tRNA nucleotidyltransferase (CCA-adding enzyme)
MINEHILKIEKTFNAAGHEIYLVGGCVRDQLVGVMPKDIDLATTATPEEQIEIYKNNDISYIPTGLQHGTITVVMDHIPYEITTLRIDQNCDGRHADVAFTKDIEVDLSRRDLTINAIAMKINGEIIDPFNGVDDLRNNVVRFVGISSERIKEDYLRILRWFRFNSRFGSVVPNSEAINAITENRDGLKNISVERIWMEIKNLIKTFGSIDNFKLMNETGVSSVIGIDFLNLERIKKAQAVGVSNPAMLIGIGCNTEEQAETLAKKWKFSTEEKFFATFFARNNFVEVDVKYLKSLLVSGIDRDVVNNLAKMNSLFYKISDWKIPSFPIKGEDLINVGVRPGPFMGKVLKDMKFFWEQTNYSVTKDDLMTVLGVRS